MKVLVPAGLLAVAVSFTAAYADDHGDKLGSYQLLTTISIPGGLSGFDISWVDSGAGRYYLADRGSATATPPVPPRVDVIDTDHDTYLFSITGFAGPNGVLTIRNPGDDDQGNHPGELWVGDADSTAKVVDLKTNAIIASVPTGGTGRADELAYDSHDKIIAIANDRDTPPYLTFISAKKLSVLGKLSFPGAVFGSPATNHGLEQTVWDGRSKHFYTSVPATGTNPKGEVDEIDPVKETITRAFPTTCGPAGLALLPGEHLITSCGDVIDIASGSVIHTVSGVGGDEIWYNRGDERVYFGSGTNRISVNVVDGINYSLITTLTVGSLTTTPTETTHSVAADSENNHIFVPVSNVGVRVYSDDADQGDDH